VQRSVALSARGARVYYRYVHPFPVLRDWRRLTANAPSVLSCCLMEQTAGARREALEAG